MEPPTANGPDRVRNPRHGTYHSAYLERVKCGWPPYAGEHTQRCPGCKGTGYQWHDDAYEHYLIDCGVNEP